MEISEIKSRLTLSEVIKYYGLKADKQNRLKCPFHEDHTPSMQLYYKTQTAFCFSSNCKTHGKAVDVIDFILHKENCTKHEAIKKTVEIIGGETIKPQATTIKNDSTARVLFLERMFTYFKNAVSNSKPAQEYLQSRCIEFRNTEVGYNAAQFHHGERKEEQLINDGVKYGLLLDAGLTSKTGDKAYKVFGKGCIVFAMRNQTNEIVSLYFRSTLADKEQRHFYLRDRQGLYPHYPPPSTKKLILTESIIDCATLLQQPEIASKYNLLALYGTNGFTEEHQKSIKELKELEEIIFFLNGDEAGQKAAAKYAPMLKADYPHLKITSVAVPQNEDVNSLLQGHSPEILTHLIDTRIAMQSPIQLKDINPLAKETDFIFSSEKSVEKSSEKEKATALPIAVGFDTSNPHKLLYTTDTAVYAVQGGVRSEPDSMKVTLVIGQEASGRKSRTKLDLYEDKQIEKAARDAAEKLTLRSDLIEADLSTLTDHLEHYRNQQAAKIEHEREEINTIHPLTPEERSSAEALLKTRDLFTRLNELIGKAGVVGEEQTRLFLFVIASSYRMPGTLHALVQGSSGSGKTHLIVKIAHLMPPEHVKFLTRVTESSFYNYGEHELKHHLFCMEDLDGLKEEAFLAFRELQSREQLTSSTSEKDEKGNIRARIRTVRGPIASLSATTKGEIYEDNMSRCFLVSVDERPEQTEQIIAYQNRRAAGGIDKDEEKQTINLLRNCIRILSPLEVINPYAGKIRLPEEAHKIRRLNDLYQSFVRQVTLLNQYQRKKDTQGRLVAEKEDLRQASEIMFDSIMLKVDELDGSLRQFYERLKTHIETKGKEYRNYAFGRKEIRDALRVSKSQQHRFFNDLSELEYLSPDGAVGAGRNGHKYKILVWDDMQALRTRIRNYLQDQLNEGLVEP